ncbi:MAG: 4-hydroxy-3-methylbut-2-enyl diphosphate reductase [Lentisphaeria bacterium]|nr:4-hydroxy-3-methylbut-2-enyl diphosphate reductase [Lentisphaeria bacterium]
MQNNTDSKKLFIARVHGFCNGVQRALKCVYDLLPEQANKVYVYNEIVHNSFVVNELKSHGVQFTKDLDLIPPHSTVVWSAHGVPPQLVESARQKQLVCVDATCPLVQKVHDLAKQHSAAGNAVIFIGHKNHPETVGVIGCGDIIPVSTPEDCETLPAFAPERKVTVLTQTTLCWEDVEKIIDKLRERYPALELLSGICYATGERQSAVKELVEKYGTEHILVIGSPNSSNSRRLCETAEKCGATAQLIDAPQEIAALDLSHVKKLGITAGASAPEILLEQAISILKEQHNFDLYGE